MTTLADIRAGLAAALDVIPGLMVSELVPVQVHPPCVFVASWEVEYDQSMVRGSDRYRVVLRLIVGSQVSEAAQQRLDELCAPSGEDSIKRAIEADMTLGGRVEFARVVRIGPAPQMFEHGSAQYLGADIDVEVMARGT